MLRDNVVSEVFSETAFFVSGGYGFTNKSIKKERKKLKCQVYRKNSEAWSLMSVS